MGDIMYRWILVAVALTGCMREGQTSDSGDAGSPAAEEDTEVYTSSSCAVEWETIETACSSEAQLSLPGGTVLVQVYECPASRSWCSPISSEGYLMSPDGDALLVIACSPGMGFIQAHIASPGEGC